MITTIDFSFACNLGCYFVVYKNNVVLVLFQRFCTESSNMCRIFVAENLALHRKFHDVYCVRYIHTACNPVLLHEKVLTAWNLIPQKVPLVVAE